MLGLKLKHLVKGAQGVNTRCGEILLQIVFSSERGEFHEVMVYPCLNRLIYFQRIHLVDELYVFNTLSRENQAAENKSIFMNVIH